MCESRSFKVFRDEQFVYYFFIYRLWNLVSGSVVLLDEEMALLRLGEIPYVEDGKSVEQISDFGAKMRVLVGGVKRPIRRVGFLPLICQIDGPCVHN